MASKKRVFLDANFFLLPFQFRVDIFSELARVAPGCEICTIAGVKDELEALSSSNRDARAALKLLERVKIVHKDGPVDEALLGIASPHDIICTNDKVLKEKIRRKGAPVIYLRQGRLLAVDGYI
jgi:hypothetical protein